MASSTSIESGRTPAYSASRVLNPADWIAIALMIIGGLNWGLVGLFGIDLVATLFGNMSVASRIVYALVGLAAIYGIALVVRLGSNRRA